MSTASTDLGKNVKTTGKDTDMAAAWVGQPSANGQVTFVEEAVRSGVRLLTSGIEVARMAATGIVATADAVVSGVLTLAKDWTKGGPLQDLAGPTVDVARQAWTAGRSSAEQVIAAV
jgi:hypothetical protein